MPDDLQTLTLSELHERLKQQGVPIALSKLSEFISSGDVAEQLHVGGNGSRRQFLPDTLTVLTEFLPKFRGQKGISWDHAPAYLRSFLKGENSDLVPVSSPVPETPKLPVAPAPAGVTVLPADWIQAANVFKAALAAAAELTADIATIQRPQALADDRVFDADGAARYLCCTVRMLRRNVPASFRLGKSSEGDRWYRRDLLSLKVKGGER